MQAAGYTIHTYLTYHACTLCMYTSTYIFSGLPAMTKGRLPTTMLLQCALKVRQVIHPNINSFQQVWTQMIQSLVARRDQDDSLLSCVVSHSHIHSSPKLCLIVIFQRSCPCVDAVCRRQHRGRAASAYASDLIFKIQLNVAGMLWFSSVV